MLLIVENFDNVATGFHVFKISKPFGNHYFLKHSLIFLNNGV